jgi:hypothetical protein
VTNTYWNGNDLLGEVFPEPRWAVPGVLPEGMNVLAGSPKVGKSWLALGIALAVARGGHALGKIAVDPGEVLFLALEDTGRRLQGRLAAVLEGPADLSSLHLHTAWPSADEGGNEDIAAWLDARKRIRLVVVDVLAKYRAPASDRTSAYQADYDAISGMKDLADRYGVSFLVLHHTRKAASDDFLDTVSGTQGIAGAADSVLVLRRSRSSADATLGITGRDVDENEHALKFDPKVGSWTLLDGPATDYTLSTTRRSILAAVRAQEGIGPKAIAETIGEDYELVKKTVQRMAADDQLDTDGNGHYFPLAELSPLSPLSPQEAHTDLRSPSPGDRDSRDTRDTFDAERSA